jgi:uncharacterized protein GlcG (DUF336 family)
MGQPMFGIGRRKVCGMILGLAGILLAAWLTPQGSSAQTLPVQKQLPVTLAVEAGLVALEACQKQGYRVSATVVDQAGVIKAALREDGAGPHTLDSSRRKAYTSASMRARTAQVEERVRTDPTLTGLRNIDQILPLAGGVPISAGNEIIGAIGVAGAPGGDKDEACATAGIDKIKDRLK